jgi:hypothetical protein
VRLGKVVYNPAGGKPVPEGGPVSGERVFEGNLYGVQEGLTWINKILSSLLVLDYSSYV